MTAEDGLPTLRQVIDTHELAARKALGQNFLLDLNLTRRIARTAGSLHDHDVFEVGPGPGGLTRALLMEGARKVVAVERDPRCLSALAEISAHYPQRLQVIEGDALRVNPHPHLSAPVRIVANLPYNIGTELLIGWLSGDIWWSTATLMFQLEVAQRIVAAPGSAHFGRLSVLAQWRTEARIVFEVPARAFTPPPKVTSAIVHLRPRAEPLAPARLAALEAMTAAAFGQRRKMLRGSLKSLGVDTGLLLAHAGVDGERRAETLSIPEFCALARAYDALRNTAA